MLKDIKPQLFKLKRKEYFILNDAPTAVHEAWDI